MLFIGVDLGTSAVKLLLMDENGKIHNIVSKEYPLYFPHHGAVAFGNYGKELFEVFKYIGVPVEEIGYNQPAGVRYPTENPWRA